MKYIQLQSNEYYLQLHVNSEYIGTVVLARSQWFAMQGWEGYSGCVLQGCIFLAAFKGSSHMRQSSRAWNLQRMHPTKWVHSYGELSDRREAGSGLREGRDSELNKDAINWTSQNIQLTYFDSFQKDSKHHHFSHCAHEPHCECSFLFCLQHSD